MSEKAGDLAIAKKTYIAAMRSDIREPLYKLNLARILAIQGNTQDYHVVLTMLLNAHPEHMEGRLLLADSLEKDGQVDRAIRVLRTGLEVQPSSIRLHHDLGFALLKKMDPKAASFHFETMLKHADLVVNYELVAKAEFGLALLDYDSGNTEQADHHLRRALAADSNLSGALLIGVDVALAENDLITADQRAQRLARLPKGDRPQLAMTQTYPISTAAKTLISDAYRSTEPE